MKVPLRYQTSEYDCVPTTFLNAFTYLFEREEIPPEVMKAIVLYSLDTFDRSGEAGKYGTTRFAIEFICRWLNYYHDVKGFGVECERLECQSVNLGNCSKMISCLQNGGVVLARIYLDAWHYVLVTDIDEKDIYLFDPYYREEQFDDDEIDMIDNSPFAMNRRVSRKRFGSFDRKYYALSETRERECVLMNRRTQTKTTHNDTVGKRSLK